MTTEERLAWLIANAHTISIHANDHRSVYETIRAHLQHIDEDESIIAQCESADSLIEVQVYPITPVGFYHISRPTLDEALSVAYEMTLKDLNMREADT